MRNFSVSNTRSTLMDIMYSSRDSEQSHWQLQEKMPCVSLLLRFCSSCFWRFTLFVTLVYIQTVAGLWRDKLPMSIIEKLDVGRRCAVKKAKLETVSR